MPNILLTGSSRGIGAAIAATLAARDDVRLIGHGTTSGIAADFADPAAPQTLWNAALDALGGRIDVLINNAGEIGRASWRESVWQYVYISGGAVSLKKTKEQNVQRTNAHNN